MSPTRRVWASLLVAGLLSGGAASARGEPPPVASEPVDITILQTVNLPWQAPEVIVSTKAALERLHIEVVIDAAAGPVEDASDVPMGATRSITWKATSGRHRCEVRVSGVLAGNGFRQVESASVDVVPPLQVDFAPGNVDLVARTLHFRSRSDVAVAELTLLDIDGRVLHQAAMTIDDDQPGKPITLSWPEVSAPVAKLSVRVFGTSDSWADLEWAPIQIEVPHDPIFFRDTVVLGSRADKLAAAYQAVRRVAHDYAGVPGLRLYVLGLASLEEKADYAADRARAVAKYFQKRGGIELPILAGSSVEPDNDAASAGYVQAFVAVDEPAHSPWVTLDAPTSSTSRAPSAKPDRETIRAQ